MQKEYLTNSSSQTKKLGEKIAREVINNPPGKKAVIIGLKGDLGSGKTAFLQGFAKGLGIKQKILSPTFVLMKRYDIKNQGTYFKRNKCSAEHLNKESKCSGFYHFDCYRIDKPRELLNFNFKEIISNSKNIITIEWAERIAKVLPKKMIWVEFIFVDKNKRKILFSCF